MSAETTFTHYRPPAPWEILTPEAKNEILSNKAVRYGSCIIDSLRRAGQLGSFIAGEAFIRIPYDSAEFVSFWHPRHTANGIHFMQQAVISGLKDVSQEAAGLNFAGIPLQHNRTLVVGRDFLIQDILEDASRRSRELDGEP